MEREERKKKDCRKRKTVSPIKDGPDYNVLLRKQEVSASPALKKHKDTVEGESDEDEEITIVRNSTASKMSGDESEEYMEQEERQQATRRSTPSFTFKDFTDYMDTNINTQFLAIRQNLDSRLGALDDKVGMNGLKLHDLERRIWKIETGQSPSTGPPCIPGPPGMPGPPPPKWPSEAPIAKYEPQITGPKEHEKNSLHNLEGL